ncbi:hypothetical protein AVEN_211160-1 [Araneus ventricosus]|uniref:Uncharacterized protein n=1 Tax=Araneus ventricosus TaxID=182803 RepID=A0A4Y2DHU2_ARAVE|nr:hypothetical protein AVEN_258609-1 [Araneus ventricosus]GBM51531.1 hypothetical protein AVEN_211160-1 [Araneus ventricosus]
MSIDFFPSLQMMSCVQIAIPILNCPKTRQLINCYTPYSRYSENIELCNLIEKMVMKKIQLIVAPLLQTMVKNNIMSMFSQIIECKNTYSLIVTDCVTYVDQNYKFIWKFDGTIDQRKSAKALIANESLHIKERFQLACNYCLIDDAYCLWNRMQAMQKSFTPLELECHLVVKLWAETFQEESVNMRMTSRVLESSALQHNIFMLYYVLKMLPYEIQPHFLLNIALKDDVDATILRFCLSRLHMSDKETVFKDSPVKVLQCFVTWPYQWAFLDVAGYLWTYLSKEGFCEVLWFILHKLMDQDWSDFNLMQLLIEFWSESPTDFKEYTKQQTIFGPLMVVLNCNMQSFPRSELNQAAYQGLEQYLDQFFPMQ